MNILTFICMQINSVSFVHSKTFFFSGITSGQSVNQRLVDSAFWSYFQPFGSCRLMSSTARHAVFNVRLLSSVRLTASADWYCHKDSGDPGANNNIVNTLSGRWCSAVVREGEKDSKRGVGGDLTAKDGRGEESWKHVYDWLESFFFVPSAPPLQSSIPSFCLFSACCFSAEKKCVCACACVFALARFSPARSQLKRRLGHEHESQSSVVCV